MKRVHHSMMLAVCVSLVLRGHIELYFVSLPGWFLAATLYVVLNRLYRRQASAAAVATA